MTEHFDDMMRSRLNNLESDVPQEMFDNIRGRMDAMDQSFDAAVNDHIGHLESSVPAGLFNNITNGLEEFDNAFDQNIKSSLGNYQSTVPANMWSRIMTEKEKRRPIAWWWAAAILFLLVGAGGAYMYHQKQTAVSLVTGDNNFNQKNATENTINANKINPSGANGNSENMIEKSSETGNDGELNSPDFATGNSTSDYDAIKGNSGGGFFSSITKNKQNGELLKDTDEENESSIESGYTVDGQLSNMKGAALNEDPQMALRQLIRSSFYKLSPLQLLQANLKTPIIPCPINGDEPRNDWYADVYASPMMAFKNVTDKISGKNVRTGMDSTLHKQVSFNAGINLVKNIGEHFLLKAGVQYNQVNELFKNTRVNEIKLITTVTIRTVILSPGDTIYIRDTSVIQQIGTVTKQTQNRYKSWDIPIILGYEFGGKDLRLNANAGVIANISSTYRGNMLDTAQQTVNIADYKTTGVYKTKIGLSLYAGLAVVKAIGNRTDFMVEPHVRVNISNTTSDAAWFKQKNILAGISIGLRYKINGSRQR